MSLIEENDFWVRTDVMASSISSRASICSSAEGELSGPELCLTQVQCNRGICMESESSVSTRFLYIATDDMDFSSRYSAID
jgi:hypothetical protein